MCVCVRECASEIIPLKMEILQRAVDGLLDDGTDVLGLAVWGGPGHKVRERSIRGTHALAHIGTGVWSQFYRLAAIIFRSYELYSLTALFSWWTAAVAILTFLLLPPLPLCRWGPGFRIENARLLHNLYQNENLLAERWRRKYYKTIKVFTRHRTHNAQGNSASVSIYRRCDMRLANKDRHVMLFVVRDEMRCR